MIDDTAQLTEAFAAHEHLAPNADDVLLKSREIARSIHRRRWAVRATGGAVLASGLVAGGIALPGRGGASPANSAAVSVASGGGSSSPSAAPSSAAYTTAQDMAAYFAAGYDYTDATQLATLWNETDINQVKADAGQKLLEGQTLPVQPSGTPETPVNTDVSAFFAAGYTYNDAVKLGKLWHISSYQAKAKAGKELVNHQPVPYPPSGSAGATGTAHVVTGSKAALAAKFAKGKVTLLKGSSPATETQADTDRAAFFAAGYDYNDAVALGNIWHVSDPWQVKADAGQKLLAGQTLPIAPGSAPNAPSGGGPVTQTDKDVNAFFAAGYTYNDAVKLGNIWNNTNTYQVKAEAGKKLLDGQTLPIAP
jgi:hypothetical protein